VSVHKHKQNATISDTQHLWQ